MNAMIDQDLSRVWERVQARLKFALGEAVYKSWLKHLELEAVEGSAVALTVSTRFVREWIYSHYMGDLLTACKAEMPGVMSIDVRMRANKETVVPMAATTTPQPIPVQSPALSIVNSDPFYSAPLDPRYNFANFVVDKSNELAHAAAQRVAESPSVIPGCNPLFLYGGVGLGKTHLMHAIGGHIRAHNPERKVMYLSAEKFMYQFISALRQKEVMSFKEQFRSVDVLMIDDVQFISGKDSTQEEFFHTFNALIDQNKQLVISGDRSPSDLEGLEERVRSRLGWGLVADINATTYELRLGVLQMKCEQLKVSVPKEVLEFLARKIVSNIRELEGALNKVVAHSNLIGRLVTLESTQDILSDLLRAKARSVTIEDIKRKVAEHCNIRVSDMHSARRTRHVARPRQLAMYLSKKLTTSSLPEIGRQFGGKDHTTVLHAVRKVEELVTKDPQIAEDVRLLTRILES